MSGAYYKLAGQSTAVAAEDLTGKCNRFVKLGANGVSVCDTLGEEVFGVLRTEGLEGEAVLVHTAIDGPVIYGGTVASGTALMTDAEGRAITRVTGAGNALVGKALEAGAVDEHRSIHLKLIPVLD